MSDYLPPLPPKTTLTDGSPVTPDHREIDPTTGMQKAYVVLSAAERAKGFIRPVRRTYIHMGAKKEITGADGSKWLGPRAGGCYEATTMGLALAETWARDPYFYSGTYCATCQAHFPVEEFVWEGTDEELGE